MGNYDDYMYNGEAQEHDLMIIWGCPNCDFEYEDYPGINEADTCPDCECRCIRKGVSYC